MENPMSKKRIGILAAALVAALLTAAVAQKVASGHMHDHGDMMGMGMFGEHHMLGFMTDYLDLTDQQQQQIKTIFQNERPKVEPLVQDLKGAHQQIQAAMEAGSLDQTQALSIIEAHKDTFAQLLVEHAKTHAAIMNVLTPAQQDKLKQLHAKHEAHAKQWMSEHHGEGQQPAPPPQ
jgi:Spy/CpxP family protein refolding chaperone